MTPRRPRLALIDPLTLKGREFLKLLETTPSLAGDLEYFHTEPDDEQQIAELGGEPGLVPPLSDPAALAGFDAVVVAGSTSSPRLTALARAAGDLGTVVVDMGASDELLAVSTPVLPPVDLAGEARVVRVPHPGVVASREVLGPLEDLGPERLVLHVVEPVSVRGTGGVEALAREAAARLRGERPEEDGDHPALAFNLVTAEPDRLAGEAALLLAPLAVAATRAVEGRFHGHVVHLGVQFAHPVEYRDLEERWEGSERLAATPGLLNLDSVPDSRAVHLGAPALSPDGTTLAVTAAVDGLLLGGALTALELLEALL